MNNILVLINLAAGADKIAKLALKVAQQLNANLLLCNVFELPVAHNMVLAGYDDMNWQFDDNPCMVIEQLVDKLETKQQQQYRGTGHQPQISCLEHTDFSDAEFRKLVIDNDIKMVITVIPDLLDLKISGLLPIINNATCPFLIIPEYADFDLLDNAAYLTDLRYCDVEVVKFLKAFNTKIFVTHISSSGIPDLADNYAQNLLSDAIASKVPYNRLFLRNIRGTNRKTELEAITRSASVKFFTIVNKKHYLLERFLSDDATNRRIYHHLPLLIMPYPNWHM